MTSLALLVPIASVSIYEGVLRFAIDPNYSRQRVLSTSLAVMATGAAVAALLLWLLRLGGFIWLPPFFHWVLFAQMLQIFLAQYTRARGRTVLYAVSGVVLAGSLAVFNIALIAALGMGVDGYMLGMFAANLTSISVLIWFDGRDLRRPSKVSPALAVELLRYSLPLVPNAAMWWLISGSSRFVLLHFEGLRVVGLYAVASRIPSVLSMLTLVFGRAWQQSAFEEVNSETRARFYSRVFEYLVLMSFLATSLVLLFLKTGYELLIAREYAESWIYVPVLILAVLFQSFASFFGTNYSAAMKTGGALTTSILGGVASVGLSVVLVPLWGGMGASSGVAGGFLVMWLLRVVGTRSYVQIAMPSLAVRLSAVVVGAQMVSLYVGLDRQIEFVVGLSLFGLLAALNWGHLAGLIRFLGRHDAVNP
ncbi:polysaccharide biosynthesis protein [Nocardioides szechwanensis]|nr:polysaccharide biosynthesis protein [Nocardioides szechwanensis]